MHVHTCIRRGAFRWTVPNFLSRAFYVLFALSRKPNQHRRTHFSRTLSAAFRYGSFAGFSYFRASVRTGTRRGSRRVRRIGCREHDQATHCLQQQWVGFISFFFLAPSRNEGLASRMESVLHAMRSGTNASLGRVSQRKYVWPQSYACAVTDYRM